MIFALYNILFIILGFYLIWKTPKCNADNMLFVYLGGGIGLAIVHLLILGGNL